MLQGGGGDQQIGAVVAEGGRELSPAAGDGQIHRQQPLSVQAQQALQPARQLFGKGRIRDRLPGDSPLDLADAHHTEKEVVVLLPGDPGHHTGIALAAAQLREHHRVDQVHGNSRGVSPIRSKGSSSCGRASSSSGSEGAWA